MTTTSKDLKSATDNAVETSPPITDKETGLVDVAPIDPVAEKKVVHKLDSWLTLLFCGLYMMSVLDRSNIGNAGLTSFEEDLGLTGNQYGVAVSIVYASYISFEPICAVLFKTLSPKYTMAFSVLGWTAITVSTAFIKNYHQLIAMRVLLGAFEAAVIPNITLYITMAYNRNEYAVRKAYVQISAAVSGAFGGLLAFGLTQIQHPTLKGWQFLYMIEGLISFVLIPATLYILPNDITTARWLTLADKEVVAARQERNKRVYDEREKFAWSEVLRALKDWKVWVQALAHFGTNTTLFSVTTFMPRIISGLGFTTRVRSQLLTVPVYFIAGLSFFISARLADRWKKPSLFMLISLGFLTVGYVLLIAVDNVGGRFLGLFVISLGMYSAATLNIVWCAQIHAGYFKRAIATAMVQVIGNISGAVMGFIFTTQSAPRYKPGMWFAFGVTLSSACCVLFLRFMLGRENEKKKALIAQGAPDQPELGDCNPHFLYYI